MPVLHHLLTLSCSLDEASFTISYSLSSPCARQRIDMDFNDNDHSFSDIIPPNDADWLDAMIARDHPEVAASHDALPSVNFF